MNSLFPPVVRTLLIINVAMFALTQLLAGAGISLTVLLGLHFPGSPNYMPWQWLTHFFMHGNLAHIFSNLLALWMFGAPLENYMGGRKFATYYFVTAFGAALLFLSVQGYGYERYRAHAERFTEDPSLGSFQRFVHDSKTGEYGFRLGSESVTAMEFADLWAAHKSDPLYKSHAKEIVQLITEQKLAERDNTMVGASGAVFGILLAFGLIFPNQYVFIGFFFPLQAKYFVALYGFWELYRGMENAAGDNVAHFAHLGGMLFGYILLWFWKKKSGKHWF